MLAIYARTIFTARSKDLLKGYRCAPALQEMCRWFLRGDGFLLTGRLVERSLL